MTIETLKSLSQSAKTQSLRDLAKHADASVVSAAGWTADTSRQYVTPEINAALLAHADRVGLNAAIDRLFNAEIVNPSEDRPALHWALRMAPESELTQAEHNTTVRALAKAETLIRDGAFSTIVHIGIGGSDFGPDLN